MIFGGHIKAFSFISHWQLLQTEKGKVRVDIIQGDGYNTDIEQELVQFFNVFKIEATLNYVNFIEKQKNGKQKFLIQGCK